MDINQNQCAMKKSKKVLMTSDKTWIRKEEYDNLITHTQKLQDELLGYFYSVEEEIEKHIKKKR